MEILLFFWILFAIITGSIATSKNRNGVGWGILGLLLGIFAVIWIACLPKLED